MNSEDLLTPFERSLLTALTAGDHPVLGALREQVESATAAYRNVSEFGLTTDLAVAADLMPVVPADFTLSDVSYSLVYGRSHFVASWGPPSDQEPGNATLEVRGGFVAVLTAQLVFELWPMEPQAGGGYIHQIDPAFAAGPHYTRGGSFQEMERDMAYVADRLATATGRRWWRWLQRFNR